ncbi:MAG TPA: SRPBCC family protein [Nitrososphaerales archaeon]|nr:SRPBCC family protein [Nitrososphaerales archaeon]
MVSINASVEVNASSERIWSIISDIDREPEFWKGLNSARITKREGSVIEREVDVGFMGHTGHQIIKLDLNNSKIEVEMTSGPLIGSRTMKLVPLQNGANTRLESSWNFSFSKVPIFARGFVKSQIESVTKNALEKIAIEAEGKKPTNKVVLVSSK